MAGSVITRYSAAQKKKPANCAHEQMQDFAFRTVVVVSEEWTTGYHEDDDEEPVVAACVW